MVDDAQIEQVIAPYVDVVFYLEQYPDVRETAGDPVEHYNRNGWMEGRDPNQWFCTKEYLRLHRDVDLAGINPLWHYVTTGRAEGRVFRLAPEKSEDRKVEKAEYEPFFDAGYYSRQLGIEFSDKSTALDHFIAHGDLALVDPHPAFSSEFYHMTYLRTSQIKDSPLLHFIREGRKQGNLPNPMLSARLKRIDDAKSADDASSAWIHRRRANLLSENLVMEALEAAAPAKTKTLYVSVSHDDFLENTGGIQICLAKEMNEAVEKGHTYVHISPLQALMQLDDETDPAHTAWKISVNGEKIGVASGKLVAECLGKLVSKQGCRSALVLHHILGHSVEAIEALHRAIRADACYYWLHDYLFACEQYNLLRNDVEYCAAPSVDSNACTLCVHGKRRTAHLERVGRLFEALNPVMLAPSQSIADTWEARSPHKHKALHVVPHCEISEKGRTVNYIDPNAKKARPIRIAYIGYPVYQKGWHAFETLAWTMRDDPRYEFIQLGEKQSDNKEIMFAHARASAKQPDAMVDALQDNMVDAVVIWAEWPETFSIVTIEALAAGAFVITRPGAGNTYALAKKSGRGFIEESVGGLIKAFAGDEWYERMAEGLNAGLPFGSVDYSKGLTIRFDQNSLASRKDSPPRRDASEQVAQVASPRASASKAPSKGSGSKSKASLSATTVTK